MNAIANQKSTQSPTLDANLEDGICELVRRIKSNESQIGILRDRICGTTPQTNADYAEQPVNGFADAIKDQTAQGHQSLQLMENCLSDIESALFS